MLALTSVWTTILLAAAVALGPIAIDMYLPALPQIGRDFGAGADQVQLTLSIYLAGFAVAQLICGPLADRFGRKPIMIGGFVLFAAASLGCAFASSIESLQAYRFLQALGGSAGPVLGRAVVRDIYKPRDAARVLALLASIMALAPAIAPTLGGFMTAALDWPSIFIAMGAYSLVMVVVIAVGIPEPLNPEHRQPLRPCVLLANYRKIATDVSFLGYTFTNAAVYGGLFAFLSGSAFVLIDFFEVPAAHYGFYFATSVAGYILGNLISMRLGRRLLPDQTLGLGLITATASGVAMAALAWAEVYNVWAVMAPQAVFMVGAGLLLPQTMAGALANFPTMAGSASALFGFLQMAVAGLAGVLVGQLHDGTSLVMSLTIAGFAIAALVLYLTVVKRYPAPGFEPETPAASPDADVPSDLSPAVQSHPN
ncbi:MAG: multidrug effflux MFS transporter [Pseudomonadota bacterium]|nr:multidrug effflux MFS transporter [Pseudomonadota bacterium]